MSEADYPPDNTVRNSKFYRLYDSPTFLRVADIVPPRDGITHFCEIRARRLDLNEVWPIIAQSVDQRIKSTPTPNVDYYKIDYPAQKYQIALHAQFILVQTYDDKTAQKRAKKLKNPDLPDVTRTNLPY